MKTPEARYEVRGGKLHVDGEAVPLRKGLLYAALARDGRNGYAGPVSRAFFDDLLRADRRMSIRALARELAHSAA
jgi:hypothetical protein